MAGQVIEMQLKQICQSWTGILGRAADDKRAFNVIAEQCSAFYSPKKGTGFMWEDGFKKKYLGPNITNPTFQVTVAKAFEYVAIIGPLLYWQYPHRQVNSNKPLGINPEVLFGEDPMQAQYVQMLAQKQQELDEKNDIRNLLYSTVLNYIQREQPGGGLAQHTENAITESLVKGRGCLWTESYKYPGSSRNLVGSFYDTVNNLIIDADCVDPTLTNCKWIARRRMTPYWELEQKFDLPKNYLRDKAKFESGASQGITIANKRKTSSKDLIEWYEIYTRCGIGCRIDGATTSMDDAWDEVVGDYAYLAVCTACDFPLNCQPDRLDESDDDAVAAMFEWPCGPLWADDKWPVSCLDYYHDPASPWPIAPLSAGLGELICLNILIAAYISQAYESGQSIVAYIQSAASTVEKQLKSAGPGTLYIPLVDGLQKSIQEVVSFLNRPAMNNSLIDAIEFVLKLFEQRTGLSELLYGSSPTGAQDRSAAATNIKNDRVQVRPDYMAKKVAAWQSEVAQKEAIVMRFHMTADDVEPLLGPLGAFAWQQLVEMEDPEMVIRGMKCTVEASDVRKPDKARETANMQALIPNILPVFSEYGAMTQNYDPLNGVLEMLGESMEQDMSKMKLPSQQPPTPEQQQQQQLAMEEQAAKADKLRADAEKSRAGAQDLLAKAGLEEMQAQQKMQIDAAHAQFKLQADQATTQQKLQSQQGLAALKMQADAAKTSQAMQAEQARARQTMGVEAAQAGQRMQIVDEEAQQKRQQSAVQFWQVLQEKMAMQKLKEQAMRAQAQQGGTA